MLSCSLLLEILEVDVALHVLPVREGEGAVLDQVREHQPFVSGHPQIGMREQGEDDLAECTYVTLLADLLVPLELLVGIGGLLLVRSRLRWPEQLHDAVELASIHPDSQILPLCFGDVD